MNKPTKIYKTQTKMMQSGKTMCTATNEKTSLHCTYQQQTDYQKPDLYKLVSHSTTKALKDIVFFPYTLLRTKQFVFSEENNPL